MYRLDATHNPKRLDSAFKLVRGEKDDRVPTGIFYQVEKPTFESNFS